MDCIIDFKTRRGEVLWDPKDFDWAQETLGKERCVLLEWFVRETCARGRKLEPYRLIVNSELKPSDISALLDAFWQTECDGPGNWVGYGARLNIDTEGRPTCFYRGGRMEIYYRVESGGVVDLFDVVENEWNEMDE